jgi:hypothetical protein
MRMRTAGSLAALAGLALLLPSGASVFGAPAVAVDETPLSAVQPVGSWVWTTDLGSLGSMPALVTFFGDGTLAVTDSLTFGDPVAPRGHSARTSLLHGVWRLARTHPLTGRRTFIGTNLWLRFNAAGLVVGYGRSRSSLELVDPDHLEGVMFVESLGGCVTDVAPIGCPDPTDPDAVWTPSPDMPAGGFPVSATKMYCVRPRK